MPKSGDKSGHKQFNDLQNKKRRLNKRSDRQKDLEIRLNETLHNLRVHEEELHTQNDDLIAAQKEITLSQRKYRNLFDFAPIGYFLMNTNGVIQEVNLTGARMIGRERESISGKPFFLFIEPSYRAILESHLREIWEGHPASAEVVILKANGETLPVDLFGIPVQDDQDRITQCRITATDISKRWQAEKALKDSERKLNSIVKTIPDIVYRLNQNGMISFISEGISRYGYMPAELIGKSMMDLVHPQDRPMAQHRVDERRTGARRTNGLELRLLTKGKHPPSESGSGNDDRVFLVNAEGLYAETSPSSGQFIGTQGIAHDITKRKRSEIERIQLEAELQKASKMEAIGTLAGGIAHDFNNLLMGIQGSISLIGHDLPDNRQNLQQIEIIEQCVKRGSDLTRQLLDFAKGGKFNAKTIDINKIVGDTAQLFERTRKMIKIHQHFAADLLTVDADGGQLEQVLLNLLINADQAMPKGGQILLVTEKIEPEIHKLKSLGLKPGKYIRILIEDKGIGMDEKTKSRIFEPFFTTKEMGRGTGLGLASAYGIIKNHGGMIDVVSSPGRGSQFFVYLPVSAGPVSAENEVSLNILSGYGTILLVDDEDIILDVGGKMLEHLGYQVIVAENGRQALDIYQKGHQDIDMVILDMIMPEMSGLETYNHLKTINPKIKVLLSSGYNRKGQASWIVARDKQDFIQKPFDLAQLSRKIAKALAFQ
jgi:two-component system, cell cycle sensor histidine kinase and response regulator CckA